MKKATKKITYICNKTNNLKTLIFETPEILNMEIFKKVYGMPFIQIFEDEKF